MVWMTRSKIVCVSTYGILLYHTKLQKSAHLHQSNHDREFTVALDELLGTVNGVNNPAVLVVLQACGRSEAMQAITAAAMQTDANTWQLLLTCTGPRLSPLLAVCVAVLLTVVLLAAMGLLQRCNSPIS